MTSRAAVFSGAVAVLLLTTPGASRAQAVAVPAEPAPAAATYPALPVSRLEPEPAPRPWTVSGSVGAGSSYGATYLLVGARVGRELALGLSFDLEGQYWIGSSPSIGKVAPGLTWRSPNGLYLGAYVARWLVGAGYRDQDAVGARGGVVLASTGAASASVGMAYERALSCSVGCESWWPEAGVGLRF